VAALSPNKRKGSPYLITERRVPELIPVLGSQLAGDVSHKTGGRLLLLSARLTEGCDQFRCLVNRGTTGVNSLPKTVTRGCDLNPGPTAPESSTLTTGLPSNLCLLSDNKPDNQKCQQSTARLQLQHFC